MSELALMLGIALSGGLGAAARYLLDQSVPDSLREKFPWGIMLINLAGSFLLGLLTGLALEAPLLGVLGVGFLGGFTTFSTASLDTVRLLRSRRWAAGMLNGLGMLIGAVALAALGLLLGGSLR